MIRRIQRREMNLERKCLPEYLSKISGLFFCRLSAITSEAIAESRKQGSSPPAVKGETAPAASPISSPCVLAMCFKTPPTGILPPRVSANSAPSKSKILQLSFS